MGHVCVAPPGFRRGGPTPWDQERLAQLVGGSIRAFSFMDSEQMPGGVGGKGLQAQEGVGPGVSLRSTRTQRHPPVGGGNREQSAERVTGRTGPQPRHALVCRGRAAWWATGGGGRGPRVCRGRRCGRGRGPAGWHQGTAVLPQKGAAEPRGPRSGDRRRERGVRVKPGRPEPGSGRSSRSPAASTMAGKPVSFAFLGEKN